MMKNLERQSPFIGSESYEFFVKGLVT
jgi:hypothetical protein